MGLCPHCIKVHPLNQGLFVTDIEQSAMALMKKQTAFVQVAAAYSVVVVVVVVVYTTIVCISDAVAVQPLQHAAVASSA